MRLELLTVSSNGETVFRSSSHFSIGKIMSVGVINWFYGKEGGMAGQLYIAGSHGHHRNLCLEFLAGVTAVFGGGRN